MIEKIKKFLETEKNLSKNKIKMLEKISKPYAVRLIKKELDFLHYDFSKISFSSIEDCRNAVSLFKISKIDFLDKYANTYNDVAKKLVKYAKNISIKDNRIDNYYFKSLKDRYLLKDNGEVKKVIKKRILQLKYLLFSSEEYIRKNKCLNLNNIIKNTYLDIYNKKISNHMKDEDQSLILENFMGYENIFEKYESPSFSLVKKTKETDLIVLPVSHSGNEKVDILYLDLIKNDDQKLHEKKYKFSNYPVDGEYHKCIKIVGGEISDITEIDFNKSKLICNFSRRSMEHNLENILWLKFVLNKIID